MNADIGYVTAVHEAGHAVATFCVGWGKYVRLLENNGEGHAMARCYFANRTPWDSAHGKQFAIRVAGPIAEVEYAPAAVTAHLDKLKLSIWQPHDILHAASVSGWEGSPEGAPDDGDLRYFFYAEAFAARFQTMGIECPLALPNERPIFEAEAEVRELIRRPSVGAAILAVASELAWEESLTGSQVGEIITPWLELRDFQTIKD